MVDMANTVFQPDVFQYGNLRSDPVVIRVIVRPKRLLLSACARGSSRSCFHCNFQDGRRGVSTSSGRGKRGLVDLPDYLQILVLSRLRQIVYRLVGLKPMNRDQVKSCTCMGGRSLWDDMFHVFQLIPFLPETNVAMEHIAEFVSQNLKRSELI